MKIVNVRIDERLIHGQVAASWSNALKANRILVIDDSAAQDDIQKMNLKMAAPLSVKLSILCVERAVQRLKENAYAGENVFIVCKSPKTACRVIDEGWTIDTINIANVSSKAGSIQIKRSVALTASDVEDIYYLNKHNVNLYTQMVPTEEAVEFMPLIKDIHF
ncbi:MAG: PTS sugar transporter subunit IIB [Erysipelotrichaceae bacterium]